MTRIFAWGSVLFLLPATVYISIGSAIAIVGLPIPSVLVFVACVFLITKYRSLDLSIARWPFVVALVGVSLAVGIQVLVWGGSSYLPWLAVFLVLFAIDTLGFIVCIRWLRLLKRPKRQYPNPYPASGYYLVPVAGAPLGMGDPGAVPAAAGTPGAAPTPVLAASNPGGYQGFALTPAGVPYQRASRATYLWPIFFGFIGGILGWAIVKDRDPVLGKRVLITGMIIGVVATILPILFYVGLIVWASN